MILRFVLTPRNGMQPVKNDFVAQGMPRNAENSDFYRFVARNPLLASLFKTKNAKMWSERS